MTNYNLKAVIPPSLLARQKKAQRKKRLEEVEKRRRKNYHRFREKRKQHFPLDDLLAA